MTRIAISAALTIALAATPAAAYNFGFVRAPDWMDAFVGGLIALVIMAAIATFVTKPMNVPFNQLYRTPLDGAAAVCFRSMQLLFVVLMLFVFAGMFLARA